MSQPLTELHGRRAGIDHDGYLGSNKGFVSGFGGRQWYLPSPHKFVLTDDFEGDLLKDEWHPLEGSDGLALITTAAQTNGVVKLTTGDAGTNIAADGVSLSGALNWKAELGGLVMEVRLKLAVITTYALWVGFSDTIALVLPASIISTTYTTENTDCVGFLFDTDATVDAWKLVSVANDVDTTEDLVDGNGDAIAPVAADYATLRIEVNSVGDSKFFYNGVQVGALHSASPRPSIALAPKIVLSNSSTTNSVVLDVDYIHVAQNRGVDGTAV